MGDSKIRRLRNSPSRLVSRPAITGILAGLALLGFYFLLLSVANSWEHALEQFAGMWYWIMALVTGFGIQVGLFSYARSYIKGAARAGATAELAGTGTVSTGSMVACCAHHLSDVLPLLGISAALVFLDKYQFFFVVLGLVSNLVGITVMLSIIQKHHLYHKKGLLATVLKGDMKKMRNAAVGVSLAILLVTFLSACMNQGYTGAGSNEPATPPPATQRNAGQPPPPAAAPGAQSTVATGSPASPPQITPRGNNEAGIGIEVLPQNLTAGKPLTFRISIDTHSGSLSFNMTKVSVLRDNNGNEYTPQEWQGDPPGGHHVGGVLIFPSPKERPQSLTLILKEIGGVKERTFAWN
ncbi:MAG: hypothetical protein HY673_02165 [Chloroflexi bacterium]|nr:hypothetical protein [Chloroflexota bacterium]